MKCADQNTEGLYEAVREELLSMAEPDLAKFSSGLLRRPGEDSLTGTAAHVLGVRLPALRRLAKRLSREDWRGYLEALAGHISQNDRAGKAGEGAEPAPVSFEEVMLWGFLVGSAKVRAEAEGSETAAEKLPCCGREEALKGRGRDGEAFAGRRYREEISVREQFDLICQFVPYIDNWSLCDSFCAGLKFAAEYPDETWEFLQKFLGAEEEYAVRFGVVMLINYFIAEDYADRLFAVFDSIGHEGYYVKMAVAWAVSACYVRFPKKTQGYLERNGLDDFTYNKALQKIIESRCVSNEVRERMKKLKR